MLNDTDEYILIKKLIFKNMIQHYKMNTNEIKGKIWNMCLEKGIFNKVKGEEFKNIQEIFEKIIKGYEQVEPSTEIFNKVIDSISFEIYNQTQNQSMNQSEPQNKIVSFDTIQKEYDELLNTPIPNKIDFTTIKIEDRDNKRGEGIAKEKQIRLEEIVMTQNKILIQILETQVKILEILKK
jgi:hypothetical protein